MIKLNFKIKKRVIGIIAIAVVCAGGLFAVKSVPGKSQVENVMKMPDVATVEKGRLDQRVSASGTAVAADEYSIFIELSQEVETVYAELGDKVEEGQLLVTYDIADSKKTLQNKLAEAQISLQNSQIALDEISTPASGTALIELQSQVVSAEKNIADTNTEILKCDTNIKQAETTLSNTKTTMENNKELLSVGGISQSELDTSIQNYENAITSLEDAKQAKVSKEQSLDSLQLSLEKAQLNITVGQDKLSDTSTANSYKKQQNTVKTAQMNIDSINDELSKLTEATYSPISGTVIVSNAVEGQMLTDSTVMMKVADLTNMDLDAYVSEYDIAKIKVGQTVEMTSDGIEGITYKGTVIKIEPTAEEKSTTSGTETVVPIKVHMDNADENVKPGFSFDMEIIVVDLDDVNYIPISSIMKNEDDSTYVFEIGEGEILNKTTVTLGTYSDMYAEIIEGLTDKSRFVKTPDDTMKEGSALSDYATASQSINKTESKSSVLDSVTGGGNMQGGGGMPSGGGGPRQ